MKSGFHRSGGIMPISLAELNAVTRELPIPIEGQELHIWYKPYAMTPELLDMAQRRDISGGLPSSPVTTAEAAHDILEQRPDRAEIVRGLIADFVAAKKDPKAQEAVLLKIVAAATVHAVDDAMQKTRAGGSGNIDMVLALIDQWDLSLEKGGPPLPITAKSLGGIAFKVTGLILDAIIEDMRPHPQTEGGSFGS
jgi:hypothetical protein